MSENRGFHPTIEEDHGYTFVDSCMQAWPDADWESAHKHGVTAFGVTSWLPHATADEALEGIMKWHLTARKHDHIITVESVDDIRTAKEKGNAALLLASQDGTFIGNKLHRIEAFYRLGLRTLILAYNSNNTICGGCLENTDPGLTKFGERVVEECNRVGLLLDCSHLGRQSSIEIIDKSEDPIIFSHSNVKEIVDCPRNINDEQIKACAEAGGVIGLAPFGPFVMKRGETTWPSVDNLINHINYVVEITGSTDHIGIGTDMSLGTYPDYEPNSWGEPDYTSSEHMEYYRKHVTGGDVTSPKVGLQGFNSYPQVTNFIKQLDERGYSDDDISKILGGNYLRVYDQVWK